MNQQLSLTSDIQQLITAEQAWHYRIIPKSVVNGNQVEFFYEEKANADELSSELQILLGMAVKLLPANTDVISTALSRYYRNNSTGAINKKQRWSNSDQNDFLVSLISEAKRVGSSDIHIECFEDRCRIRLRIDGKLIERFIISKDEYPSLINKIKIRAQLDISEKRLPQDGRISFKEAIGKLDIRISTLPTLHGEKIVLRLLGQDTGQSSFNELGLSGVEYERFINGIKKPYGLVLISGPTGSGKTTTLYTTLRELNKEHTNILTVEDPIEYTLQGINQVQLKESIGLTFAKALKTFLRQDPDIIMLGEIRDSDTAQMAIRASLTGHLVLSTIHTNSAWGAVSRLIDMGIPSFLVASTLNLTVAQRLVRRLCRYCMKEVEFIPQEFHLPAHLNINRHFIAGSCDACHFTGYSGRVAIYEVIDNDEKLSMEIRKQESNVADILHMKQVKSLADNAFSLVKGGITSIEEVYPILNSSSII